MVSDRNGRAFIFLRNVLTIRFQEFLTLIHGNAGPLSRLPSILSYQVVHFRERTTGKVLWSAKMRIKQTFFVTYIGKHHGIQAYAVENSLMFRRCERSNMLQDEALVEESHLRAPQALEHKIVQRIMCETVRME